jgi:hypothetical protein
LGGVADGQVIESSWDSFVLAVSKPDCTLDTLIEAHDKYLNSITHKGLLGSTKGGREGSLMGQLHELLKVIMSYKEGMVKSRLPFCRIAFLLTCRMRCTGIRWQSTSVVNLWTNVPLNELPLYPLPLPLLPFLLPSPRFATFFCVRTLTGFTRENGGVHRQTRILLCQTSISNT